MKIKAWTLIFSSSIALITLRTDWKSVVKPLKSWRLLQEGQPPWENRRAANLQMSNGLILWERRMSLWWRMIITMGKFQTTISRSSRSKTKMKLQQRWPILINKLKSFSNWMRYFKRIRPDKQNRNLWSERWKRTLWYLSRPAPEFKLIFRISYKNRHNLDGHCTMASMMEQEQPLWCRVERRLRHLCHMNLQTDMTSNWSHLNQTYRNPIKTQNPRLMFHKRLAKSSQQTTLPTESMRTPNWGYLENFQCITMLVTKASK